jgi:hypothetical protein
MVTAPARSVRCPVRSGRGWTGSTRQAATSSPAETSTGAKNTHRQSIADSRPPATSPRE